MKQSISSDVSFPAVMNMKGFYLTEISQVLMGITELQTNTDEYDSSKQRTGQNKC